MTTVKPPLPTVTLQRACDMRREPTDAESKLWYHLRAGRLGKLKFRRQHPVPPYIVDFCCLDRKLIVELDGSQHSPNVDAARTAYSQSQGFAVIRFWDNEALTQTLSPTRAPALRSALGIRGEREPMARNRSPLIPVGEGLRTPP